MKKLLILDKDGTIIETKSGNKFVNLPDDQKLIDGAGEAIARYVSDGWDIAIASNQGGVQAGYKSLDDAFAEMYFALDLIRDGLPSSNNSQIRGAAFCPSSGESAYLIRMHLGLEKPFLHLSQCDYDFSFRKPEPGMLLCLPEILSFDSREQYESTLMVGDRPEDEGAAKAAGMAFMSAEAWRIFAKQEV